MKPKTSPIWCYFVDIDDAKARCKLCDKVYSRKGRTTTALKSHLKAIHAEEFAEFEKLNEAAKLSSETTKEKASSSKTFPEKWWSPSEVEVDPLSNSESPPPTPPPAKRRRCESSEPPNPHPCEKYLADTMKTLANVINNMSKEIESNKNQAETDDECGLYGKLLAIKLRDLPYNQRIELMFEIDSLYLQKKFEK